MTQVCNLCSTPEQAVRRRDGVDRLLKPAFFKAMADPNRARILACLIKCARPCSVTEVAQCCSVDFSTVTRQLAALSQAGLLEGNKQGRTMWYAANNAQLAACFRDLADAIEEWSAAPCTDAGC